MCPEGMVPVGGIIMYNGVLADLPNNWRLCDGTGDTPDLRNRFIVSYGDKYNIGDTGGADTVDISHLHGAGTLVADNESAHTHGIGTYVAANESAHTHGIGTYAAANESSHTHGDGTYAAASDTHNHGISGSVSSDSHTHDVTGTSGSESSHTHGDGSYAAANDTHNHDVTGTSANDTHNHTEGSLDTDLNPAHTHDHRGTNWKPQSTRWGYTHG